MTQISYTPTTDELIIALEQLDEAGQIDLEIINDGRGDLYSFRIMGTGADEIWHQFTEYVTPIKRNRWLMFRETYNENDGTSKRSERQRAKVETQVLRMAAELTK